MQSLNDEPPRNNTRKILFISMPVLAIISALLVAHYVFNVEFFHKDTKDPNFGKFAYATSTGQYLGKIEGAKASTNEWIIKDLSGSSIAMSQVSN